MILQGNTYCRVSIYPIFNVILDFGYTGKRILGKLGILCRTKHCSLSLPLKCLSFQCELATISRLTAVKRLEEMPCHCQRHVCFHSLISCYHAQPSITVVQERIDITHECVSAPKAKQESLSESCWTMSTPQFQPCCRRCLVTISSMVAMSKIKYSSHYVVPLDLCSCRYLLP
jgi:hypothetical protein